MLPFSSPLINIQWDKDEFVRFILEPMFYLNTELEMVEKGDLQRGIRPIGKLGNGNKTVKMGFDTSVQNKHVLIDSFNLVPHNKILFYGGNENIDKVCKTNRFLWECKNGYVQYFDYSEYTRVNF